MKNLIGLFLLFVSLNASAYTGAMSLQESFLGTSLNDTEQEYVDIPANVGYICNYQEGVDSSSGLISYAMEFWNLNNSPPTRISFLDLGKYFGTSAYSFIVDATNHLVYLAEWEAYTVFVIDVTNYQYPGAIAVINFGGDRPTGVALNGTNLYVAAGSNGSYTSLSTFDVSNIRSVYAAPRTDYQTFSYDSAQAALQLSGTNLFLIESGGSGSSGIRAFDVSGSNASAPVSKSALNPFVTNPVLVNFCLNDAGDTLYAVEWSSGNLYIVDVSTATSGGSPSMTLKSTTSTSYANPSAIIVKGGIAWIAYYNTGLSTNIGKMDSWDVSSPTAPVNTGQTPITAGIPPLRSTGAPMFDPATGFWYVPGNIARPPNGNVFDGYFNWFYLH